MSKRQILRYFLIWQVGIIFIVSWSKHLFPLQTTFIGGGEQASFSDPQPYINNPQLYFRGNFDGIHYINLARRGIGLNEEAFFPLYPKLMSILHPLVKNTVLNGSLVSSFFFLLGLLVFDKLIRLDFDSHTSRWTILALLIFPTSFFFSGVYTEGLFFFLAVSAFYLARRKQWWWAAIVVSLATYTRLVGVFLIPALFLELLHQKKSVLTIKSVLPFLLMPLGLVLYMNFLWRVKGDPLAFYHVQKNFGQGRSDKIVLLYQVVYRYARMLVTVSPQNRLYPTLAFESFVSLSFITIGLIMVFKLRPSYSLFTLTSLILPTLTGSFTSMPRYALLCFPVFIFIGNFLSRYPRFRYFYLAISLSLTVFFLSLFARGYWVA